MKIFFDKDILMEIMINSIENTNDNNFKAFGALLISLPIISLMANITCDHLFVASQDERYLCWPFFICIFVFSYFCIFVSYILTYPIFQFSGLSTWICWPSVWFIFATSPRFWFLFWLFVFSQPKYFVWYKCLGENSKCVWCLTVLNIGCYWLILQMIVGLILKMNVS